MRRALSTLGLISFAVAVGCGDDAQAPSDGGTNPSDGSTSNGKDASTTGGCGTIVNISALLADPSGYDGQNIEVEGVVRMDAPGCTTRACPGFDMCCNSCTASELLTDSATNSNGVTIADQICQGNECDVQDNCGLAPGRYRICGAMASGELSVTRADPL